MSLNQAIASLFLACSLLFTAAPAHADEAPTTPQEAAMQAAWQAAGKALQEGKITLGKQATLDLPDSLGFIPAKEAREVLSAMGNTVGDSLLGMVLPLGESSGWFMVVSWEDSGYIKDDDAREWNADDLLQSLKDGTQEGNAHRREIGVPEMEVVGWVQKPQYDSSHNRLVWALESRDKGQPAGEENGINYNTYALGREGYVSINLVTGMQSVETEKPVAHDVLSRLSFNEGQRYADFNPATDKVAEYGLAALVGGVAAKKMGVLAVIAAFFAKFAKLFIIGGIALAAGARKLFSGNKGN